MAKHTLIGLGVLAAIIGGAQAGLAQCEYEWAAGFESPGVNDEVRATVVFDDGDGPATADVTWTGLLTGVFHIIDTTATHYSKDFTDTAVRFATFERRENATAQTQNRGWRMTAISGTTIISDPNAVEIQQVRLTSTDGVDTTFSDVSTLADREDIIIFAARDTITIEVTTGDPDDVILIHYPAWATGHGQRHHVRARLHNNGDGTFTGQWVARGMVWRNGHLMNPARHVTISVLSHGTIFTDDEPYDSMAWSFIYRVGGKSSRQHCPRAYHTIYKTGVRSRRPGARFVYYVFPETITIPIQISAT